MKKLLTLIPILLLSLAVQSQAQCVDEHRHPWGFPPGPEGSVNNPILWHANLGETVTITDWRLGDFSPWFVITGFWANPPYDHPEALYNLDGTRHVGFFYTHTTQSYDYRDGILYAAAGPGFQMIYYRIVGMTSSGLPPCPDGEPSLN